MFEGEEHVVMLQVRMVNEEEEEGETQGCTREGEACSLAPCCLPFARPTKESTGRTLAAGTRVWKARCRGS